MPLSKGLRLLSSLLSGLGSSEPPYLTWTAPACCSATLRPGVSQIHSNGLEVYRGCEGVQFSPGALMMCW